MIDFTGYAQGASTLDVVVDDDRAYEAIIVIGQQPPEVVNKEVTKVNNNQETRVQFVYPDPPEDDDKDRDPCKKYDRYANVCKPLPNNGQCEQGYAKLFGACFDTDAILDHETPEECQADPLCREYRERYPSDPVEPVPPCEEVEAGTLCEDEGEASTPICDEQEILTEDNRCVTQKIPITPIYPDDGSEGVLEVCPPRCGNNEDIPTPELDIDGGDNETIDPEVVIDPEPVQEEEIPEVNEEFNVEEPTMEEESSEDVEDVEESSE